MYLAAAAPKRRGRMSVIGGCCYDGLKGHETCCNEDATRMRRGCNEDATRMQRGCKRDWPCRCMLLKEPNTPQNTLRSKWHGNKRTGTMPPPRDDDDDRAGNSIRNVCYEQAADGADDDVTETNLQTRRANTQKVSSRRFRQKTGVKRPFRKKTCFKRLFIEAFAIGRLLGLVLTLGAYWWPIDPVPSTMRNQPALHCRRMNQPRRRATPTREMSQLPPAARLDC